MLQAYIDFLIWRLYEYELELITPLDTLEALLTNHINISTPEEASSSENYLPTIKSRSV